MDRVPPDMQEVIWLRPEDISLRNDLVSFDKLKVADGQSKLQDHDDASAGRV